MVDSGIGTGVGLSRYTVRRTLRSARPRQYSSRDKPTALNGARRAHGERRLAVCPGIRGSLLHFELRREYDYAASHPRICGWFFRAQTLVSTSCRRSLGKATGLAYGLQTLWC